MKSSTSSTSSALSVATTWLLLGLIFLDTNAPTAVAASLLGPTMSRHPDDAFDGTNINPIQAGVNDDLMIGAYYYPWHTNDFHNNDGYLRDYLRPRQQPSMGEYNDRNPEVISEHFRMSRQANIRLWITAWFGINSREDITLLGTILNHAEMLITPLQIAIHYETNNRLAERASADNPFGLNEGQKYYTLEEVEPDMIHFCLNYFNHPSYYKVNNGRPVIVLYLTRVLDSDELYKDEIGTEPTLWDEFEFLNSVVTLMKSTVETAPECDGIETPFIIGDQIFNTYRSNIDNNAFEILDGVSGYDTYGHMDQDLGLVANGHAEEEIQTFYEIQQLEWKQQAETFDCVYIPSVTPGFNDLGTRVRTNSDDTLVKRQLSRSLSPTSGTGSASEEGSLFAKSLEYARSSNLLDNDPFNAIFITSFNEWHEDTQIENVVVDPPEQAQVLVNPDGTITDLQNLESTTLGLSIYETNADNEISPLPAIELSPEEYLIKDLDETLTQGLTYEAYNDLYLNILRRATLLPVYTDNFGTGNVELTAEGGGSLVYMTSSPSIIDVSSSSFLIIEFWLHSERTEINEPLIINCLDDTDVSGETFTSGGTIEYKRDYTTHREFHYFVTECDVTNFDTTSTVVFEYDVRADDPDRTSLILDDIQIYSIETPERSTASPTMTPTIGPTSGPTTSPPTTQPTIGPTVGPSTSPSTSPPSSEPTIGPTTSPTTSPPTSEPTSEPTSPPAEDFEMLWCETFESSNGNFFNSKIRRDCTNDVKLKDKSDRAHSGDYSIEFKVKDCDPPTMTAIVTRDDGSSFTSVQVTFWYAIDRLDKFSGNEGMTLGLTTSGTPVCTWSGNTCTGGTREDEFTTCTGDSGGPTTITSCIWPSEKKVYEPAVCEINLGTSRTSIELEFSNTSGSDGKFYVDDIMVDVK